MLLGDAGSGPELLSRARAPATVTPPSVHPGPVPRPSALPLRQPAAAT